MRFSFSSWAIRNPIPPIVLFLVLTLAGLAAYIALPVNDMPNVVVPIVSVEVTEPGAASAELETQVTRRIEGAVSGLQGVKHLKSTIADGRSTTQIEFYLETNFDRAMSDTRDAIGNIRDQLPHTILEPVIQRIDVEGDPILTYTIEAPDMAPEALSWYVDDTLTRELLAIRGVGRVERSGGIDHEVSVLLDPKKLESFGITASEISRQLAAFNVDLPGGRVLVEGVEHAIRTLGGATSIQALRDARLSISNGRTIRLADVATVTDGGAEARASTKLNGKPALAFMVYRTKEASEVTVAHHVEAKLAALQAKSANLRITPLFSLAQFTEKNFHTAVASFFEGTILTVLVVLWFLRDRRATLLAAMAIPLSIIPTFLFIHWLGFTLNGISLLAISLVTGVLVDDAIVEIENIHRHMKQGKTPREASFFAAEEIGLAVIATTLVICAVFTPVSFMGGVPGQYFKQFGLPVAIAAFFSLLVARLLTPMLAAHFLRMPKHHEARPSTMLHRYQRLVEWTLLHRARTMLIALVVLVLSFGMVPFIESGFLPYEDYSQSKLTIDLPRGSSLEETDRTANTVATLLRKRPEVSHVLSSITEAGGGLNKAHLDIKLVPPSDRHLGQKEFENDVLPALKAIPDIRVGFANNNGEKDVSINLVSENGEALDKAASELERAMRTMHGLASVSSTASQRQPELVIIPDYEKASRLGITVEQMSDAVRIATIGDSVTNLAKFNNGTRQIPIRVRLPGQNLEDIHILENLRIAAENGTSVPLKAIASIRFSSGPTSIERYDRQRKIAIEANLDGIPLGKAIDEVMASPATKNLPADVQVITSGDAETMDELFTGFTVAIGTGLMMVYAIQVLLYRDWLQPLTRMAALPLSVGGAFFLLLATGTELDLPAVIGILMLMGIADKNSILLVDYMLELSKRGVGRREAILLACTTRARPIIMTTFAMLASMLPIALSLSSSMAFRTPMAIAVIGGLISSTALSLVFVPVLFSYARDLEEWLSPRLRRVLD